MNWIKTSELGKPVLVAFPNKTYCIAARAIRFTADVCDEETGRK